MADGTLRDLPPSDATGGAILDAFLAYVGERKLELYPAQEEAILELLDGANVILNTPTGSGKSLVAEAAHFDALVRGERSFYTSPIKALANEKFFALVRTFGADNVGLMTGDATVNRDAPIICATAEVLSNIALAEGPRADVDLAIIDEFHYYADRERGVAWQVPLLALPNTRFLLMSATFGDPEPFKKHLEDAHRQAHRRRALDAIARCRSTSRTARRRSTRRCTSSSTRASTPSTSSTSRSAPAPRRRRTS